MSEKPGLPEGLEKSENRTLVKRGGYVNLGTSIELPSTSGAKFSERQDGLDYLGGVPMDIVVFDKDKPVGVYTATSKIGKNGGWDTTSSELLTAEEPKEESEEAPKETPREPVVVYKDSATPVGRVVDRASMNVTPERTEKKERRADVVVELKHESGFGMRSRWIDTVESETSIVLIGDSDNTLTLPQGNYTINVLGAPEEQATYKAYFANQSFHWVHDYYIFLPTND